MSLNSDQYYIKRVLEGNSSDFSNLIDKYKDMVFTIAVKISGNREDAEEIAQDVFVKAYQGLAGFRSSSKFSTWLYAIAYNQSVSFIRKRQLDTSSIHNYSTSLYETYGEEDSQYSLLEDIPAKYVEKVMESLDKTDQIILTLYYKKECQVKEISRITGLSVSNIKIKLFRGRKKILEELKKIFKTELVDLL